MFAPMHQPLYRMPAEPEVQRVMRDTGMERLQAIRHVQGRAEFLSRVERGEVKTYPLGKTAELA